MPYFSTFFCLVSQPKEVKIEVNTLPLTVDIALLPLKEHSTNLLRELYRKEQYSVTHNRHF